MIPLDIRLKALLYPVTDYEKKYGDKNTVNEAKGEIVMGNMSPERWPSDHFIGKTFTGIWDKYDWIQIYLGKGYFKVISKIKEGPWTCQ